jgi:hypothetical protein
VIFVNKLKLFAYKFNDTLYFWHLLFLRGFLAYIARQKNNYWQGKKTTIGRAKEPLPKLFFLVVF